ncbi:hypothetical protein OF83DRAFT_481791 [Amylostereum chailletii]|nr:hypothetical protein OF83DRAFT_481791 [Amylostereum chailletii]
MARPYDSVQRTGGFCCLMFSREVSLTITLMLYFLYTRPRCVPQLCKGILEKLTCPHPSSTARLLSFHERDIMGLLRRLKKSMKPLATRSHSLSEDRTPSRSSTPEAHPKPRASSWPPATGSRNMYTTDPYDMDNWRQDHDEPGTSNQLEADEQRLFDTPSSSRATLGSLTSAEWCNEPAVIDLLKSVLHEISSACHNVASIVSHFSHFVSEGQDAKSIYVNKHTAEHDSVSCYIVTYTRLE